jgi:hypothetical protein
MVNKMQPIETFVDNELETQTMDLQVEKVLNENINTLEGNVDIDDQCETINIEMDNDKVQSNGVPNWSTNLGFGNVNIKLITIGFGNMNFKFNQTWLID